MSDGITDCRSDEEKKTAEMVDKICENCISENSDLIDGPCFSCMDGHSRFIPSRAAIDEKIEELRNQTAIKQDSGSKTEIASKKSIWRSPEEAINTKKAVIALHVRRVPAESILLGVANGLPEEMDRMRYQSILEHPERAFQLCKKGAVPGSSMLLKGIGNAIVPELAAEFMIVFLGKLNERD